MTQDNNSTMLADAIRNIAAGAMNEDRVREIVASAIKTETAKNPAVNESRIREIFSDALSKAIDAIPPKEIVINVDGAKKRLEGKHLHPAFDKVLKIVAAGCHVLLVGPAGSGKSSIAMQVAEALGRAFHTQGPATSEYKYLGYNDAHGKHVETPLCRAFRDGGIFCAEEIDSSSASALVAGLNMVLANGQADFGNQVYSRHENFVCIATANTWGSGADRQYVGRTQLDAATLDRFVCVYVDYDEALERAVAQNDKWTGFVQKARRAVAELKIRAVISPRASIQGATLMRAGLSAKDVADCTVWRGMDTATITKVKEKMKEYQ